MHYDPIKDRLAAVAERHPLLWRGFYAALDTLFLRAWYVRREVRRLMRTLPREDRPVRILDAGTGFGQYAHFLLREFPQARVHAVDVKTDYLDRAEGFMRATPHAGRVTFAEDDLTQLEAEGPFDLILSVDVMEHIADDEAVFAHFARVLRPGGYVVINTPSDKGGSDVDAAQADTAGEASFIGEHVRDGYNLGALEEKLRRAGLAPVHSRYTYGRYGSAAWRLLIQQPMKALGASWAFLPLVLLYYLPALPAGLLLNALDVRADNDEGTGLIVTARRPTDAIPAA
ncbi:MAG: class I SAM-dependent methyltransferase [Bacteroidetes bacterium QS_8_68_15]|nr:MAG: class I SAM-dependent methyltransferase [Bacteroidetes bacterium QS_8_68_15]